MGGMGGGPGGMPPKPLDETLLDVFDKDHNKKLTVAEVSTTLDSFAMMGGMGAEGEGPSEMQQMITKAKSALPALFALMDADGSKTLSPSELKWVPKAYAAVQKPGLLKKLTLDIFSTIDADGDEQLSEAELRDAIEGEKLERVLALLDESLPIPSLVLDADKSRAVLQANFKEGLAYLDGNGDGVIERKEMLAAVKTFKDMFVKGVKTIESMGPMLAMFSAFQQPGGGGLGAAGGGRGAGRGQPRRPARPKTEL